MRAATSGESSSAREVADLLVVGSGVDGLKVANLDSRAGAEAATDVLTFISLFAEIANGYIDAVVGPRVGRAVVHPEGERLRLTIAR